MSTQEPQMPEPDGWVTMWPAMRGGHRPVYCLGAEKPSYGDELDAMLNVYPVYKAATTLAYAEALAAHRVAQKRDCRTCAHWTPHHRSGVMHCFSPLRCVSGSSYRRCDVVQLWEQPK